MDLVTYSLCLCLPLVEINIEKLNITTLQHMKAEIAQCQNSQKQLELSILFPKGEDVDCVQ